MVRCRLRSRRRASRWPCREVELSSGRAICASAGPPRELRVFDPRSGPSKTLREVADAATRSISITCWIAASASFCTHLAPGGKRSTRSPVTPSFSIGAPVRTPTTGQSASNWRASRHRAESVVCMNRPIFRDTRGACRLEGRRIHGLVMPTPRLLRRAGSWPPPRTRPPPSLRW